ncbi:unnamed protein product [Heterobilharzia americana]|nr:unnamed protein product [Heterobilharzia americana]
MRISSSSIILIQLMVPLVTVTSSNKSTSGSVGPDVKFLSNIIGPPTQLMLEIACDILRPCIKVSWLPPIGIHQSSDDTADNIMKNQDKITGDENEKNTQNTLLAYNIRYRIIHPIELSHSGLHNKFLNAVDGNTLPYPKTIEKNITGLQYTSTPGEHLFGVIYEVSVAAVTKNGFGQEAVGRIPMPEAAPSDAPSNFRVVSGDQTSVKLAWEPPPLLYRNGIITKYQVRCYVVGSEENRDELKTLTEQSLNLFNLLPATHACLARAWTKAGPGPWSDRIQFLISPKGPSPPTDIQGYWKTPYIITVEWILPDDRTNIAHLIIHYTTQNNPDLWYKHFIKEIKTTEDLSNLSPNEGYLIRLSSVDFNGNEGQLSDIVKIHPYQRTNVIRDDGDDNNDNLNGHRKKGYPKVDDIINNMNNREDYRFSFMDIPDQPEKFTVQNFKCVHKTPSSITIEWLPPVHLANLLEYQLHSSGRSEFFTSSGVLKSVYLGEMNLHRSIDLQIDTSRPEMLNWPLVNLIGDISALEHHQQHQQQTHKMKIPNLKPNSQYKVTIRPIYRALISEGNIGAKEGIPVTIICHTEWSAPQYIKPPEILAIYSGPPDPQGATSVIEVKLHRVSEENGPIHNYYIIVSPELNTVESDLNSFNNIHLETSKHPSIDASQYDLKILSQNTDLPSNQAPYLALARHTLNLFQPNHETTIVILGSEETDNFVVQNQYYLHTMNGSNESYEGLSSQQVYQKTTELMPNFHDITSDTYDKTGNNIDTNPYYYNYNMYTKTLQVNNKRLFQSATYRVALRACSQYPDGHQLCSTSQWSERISFINPTKMNNLSRLKSQKDKTFVWSIQESPSFTIILGGLASGLIFFAVLSTILGCILRRRKQQLNRRSMLETTNQWDAQICRDLSKSIFTENSSGPNNSRTKCYSPKNNNFPTSQPSNYFLNLHTEGSHSPSNSSSGILGINPPRPSTGGLSVATNITSPLASPTNQLTISDLSPTITRSVHMNLGSTGQRHESPTRSVNSSEVVVSKMTFKVNSKLGTTNALENFQQLVRDGTIEIHRMPIAVEQLQEVIYHAKNNNYINFNQEFQAIEQISSTRYISAVHSNLDINKRRNRYPNILAYDRTRVTIQWSHHSQIGNSSGSDYINANFIDGYRKQNAYIATQAPLTNTFDDFWSMIWEQNTSVIVMLSKIIEEGQIQCDQYWPTSGKLIFSDIIITHLETIELANYTMRNFEIRRQNEHRRIWHLQYTSWPEQGIPTYSTVFLMFLRRVGTITPADCGPIVVHCSGGTGKTGVYIAINILLERMKCESVVDVFGLVNQLRMQRNYMVETQEQYQFIYTTLLESITDGNTEVPARNLYTHLQHLSTLQTAITNDYSMNLSSQLSPSSPPNTSVHSISENTNTGTATRTATNSLGYTGLQLEFRKINKLSPNVTLGLNYVTSKSGNVGRSASGSSLHDFKSIVSCEVAKKSVNFNKNRLVSIIPFDWNRVTLCPIRGVDGSDYINASLIDGYLKKNAYIACQGPMVSTVEDFWRMVWEKHSCLIVMLCSVKEVGRKNVSHIGLKRNQHVINFL